jgi:hypothetical protein
MAAGLRRDAPPAAVAAVLQALARVAADRGRSDRAAMLLGAARAVVPAPSSALDQSLRRSLGDDRFEAALAEGMTGGVEQALVHAARH